VNDVVLAVETLRRSFGRVLYVDLDVHHGIVGRAGFGGGCTVWSSCFRRRRGERVRGHRSGAYAVVAPVRAGLLSDQRRVGRRRHGQRPVLRGERTVARRRGGRRVRGAVSQVKTITGPAAVTVGARALTRDRVCFCVRRIGDAVRGAYDPGCVVVQCGADGLAGDPAGGFNLTPMGALAECVKTVTEWTRPALFLGGGRSFYCYFRLGRCC